MNKTMKRANEGLQKQCKEKEEVGLAQYLTNLGETILKSGIVQCLKICTVDKSMEIPANGCQVDKKALAQLWMTFARDWLCSGFTLVCKDTNYYSK